MNVADWVRAVTVLAVALAIPAAVPSSATASNSHARAFDRAEGSAARGLRSAIVAATNSSGTTRLVVRTKSRRTLRAAATSLKQDDLAPTTITPALNAVSVDVSASTAAAFERQVASQTGVTAVTVAHKRTLDFIPNDPRWSSQSLYYSNVNAPAAWDVTHGSADVRVAVVDSGVDVSHPDLAGKVVGAYNANTGSTNVTDNVGHGTFIAGEIAAVANNSVGIAGAGMDTSLLAVKVADSSGDIYTDTEADGITWATDHGARIINLSLGSNSADELETDAIRYAVNHGVLVVASAGNEGTSVKQYPAALPGVLSVGATVGTARTSWSTYGSWVTVGAPGENIYSTTPQYGSDDFAANYDHGDGTSFSAPLVASEAALLAAQAPQADATMLRAAITRGTTGSYGFANGRIDFLAALKALPPTTVPTFDAPDNGSTTTAVTTARVRSAAPAVKLWLTGLPPVSVPVVAGTATTALSTFGLGGVTQVHAVDCNPAGACNTTAAVRDLTVANAGPTLSSPSAGDTVGDNGIKATAGAPGGAVAFTIDGNYRAMDRTSPYAAVVPTTGLADGAHTLKAYVCAVNANVCDTRQPSNAVDFRVKSLHPAIKHVSPSAFSPNADGRKDTTTVTYSLDSPSDVRVSAQSAAGDVVWTRHVGQQSAAVHTLTWNGKRSDGSRAADGAYRVVVESSKSAPTALHGTAVATVRIDTHAPSLSSISRGGTFYPVRDGYEDTLAVSAVVGDAGSITWTVYDDASRKLHSATKQTHGGRVTNHWNGRTRAGSVASAGIYHYRWSITDNAGNHRSSSLYGVHVSLKRLVATRAKTTLTAKSAAFRDISGYCSGVYYPARDNWPGSLAYLSDHDCYDPYDDTADVAGTVSKFVLPRAVKYSGIRVTLTGQRDLPGYSDSGTAFYLDSNGDVVESSTTHLRAAYGDYALPTASTRLLDGRTLKWVTGTAAGDYYDVRYVTVSYTLYVLK